MNEPDWKKAQISREDSLHTAIMQIEESACQIALVVDSKGRLEGTVTDGDIRRGLLRGYSLEEKVSSVMNAHPLVVPPDLGGADVLRMLNMNLLRQTPIVDEQNLLLGLHLIDQLDAPSSRTNTMIIMAGGKGQRLRPYTENCPKPMLLVGDKPILEHIIERAKSEGFENFILSTHYLSHIISEHFGDGAKWNVNITYVNEDEPLGTAGALSLIDRQLLEPIVVTNGDVLTSIRYSEILDFHARHGAHATMAVRAHEWQNPFGEVKTEGVEIVGFQEKPIYRSYINAGVYVLQPDMLEFLNAGEHCDMPTLFSRAMDLSKRVVVYPTHEQWIDIGREDDFEKAKSEILQ